MQPSTSPAKAVAGRLYEAMEARDPAAILSALTPDFVGEASTGMPLGVGGRHEGRENMLGEVWGPIFAAYDVRLEVDRMTETDDGRVLVLGSYVGAERATQRDFSARFAHVLSIRDGAIAGLEQITDTRMWDAAPDAPA